MREKTKLRRLTNDITEAKNNTWHLSVEAMGPGFLLNMTNGETSTILLAARRDGRILFNDEAPIFGELGGLLNKVMELDAEAFVAGHTHKPSPPEAA